MSKPIDYIDLVQRIERAVVYRDRVVQDLAADHDMSYSRMRRIYSGAVFLARKKIGSAVEAAKLYGPSAFVDMHVRQTRIAAAYIDRFYGRRR